MDSLAILLVDLNTTDSAQVRDALTTAGHTIHVLSDSRSALKRAAEHGLIIVNFGRPAVDAVGLCRAIRQAPDIASRPILCVGPTDDVEERISLLEAGADDVMTRPFDSYELETRVEALFARSRHTRDAEPAGRFAEPLAPHVRCVVVFGPAGGVGTTTIAVNIAISHAASRPDRVLLVDLDLRFGQVATFLDMLAPQTIADLVQDEEAQVDPHLLRTYAAKHSSGLHLLAAPLSPEFAEGVPPTAAAKILDTACATYEHVVVDGGSTLDSRTLKAIDIADTLVIPVRRDIPALKATRAFVDYLVDRGSASSRRMIVLNNVSGRESLSLSDIETGLGARGVAAELPYDPQVYIDAVNEGSPVVLLASRSQAARSLARLATTAFDPMRSDLEQELHRGGLLGGLFRRG